MSYTTPRTFVNGEIETDSIFNTHLRDNIAWLATDSPACRVFNSANESIPNNTSTAVTFNSERFDNAAMHSGSSSQLVIPAGGAGKFSVGAGWQWAINAGGSLRQCSIKQNGTTFVAFQTSQPSATHASEATISTLYALAAGDFVELFAKQDSGGALNLTVASNYAPELWGVWLRT